MQVFVLSAACYASRACHVMAETDGLLADSADACSVPSSVRTARYFSDICEQAARQKDGRSARHFRPTQNAAVRCTALSLALFWIVH